MESLILWIVATTLGFIIWRKLHSRLYQLPPGPKGLPFFGSIFKLDTSSSHIQLTKWEREFGHIYKLHLMGKDIIVISGEKNVRQVLVHQSDGFAGRPHLNRVSIAHRGGFYISFGDISDRWKSLKKLVIKSLGMFGGGLQRLEEITTEELVDMTKNLQILSEKGEAFDIKVDIQTVMANIDFVLTCGRKLERKEILSFIDAERRALPLISPGGQGCELDLAPWLSHFPHPTVYALHRIEQENGKIFEPALYERMKLFSDDQHSCVLDSLFSYNNITSSREKFKDIDIRAIIEDLCSAGISTSSSAVYSFLALCIVNPGLQSRIQREIDEQIGERAPMLSDRKKLPFIEAAILELFRYISHVPIAVPHKTTREVDIGGYRLPKGIHVLVNLWSLHHDEECWDDPWSYKPERFLERDGSLVGPDHKNRKMLLPFGAGRRVCVGETMAKSRIFLTLVTLFQRFAFLPGADDEPLPVTDPRKFETGIVLYTPNFLLRVKPRYNFDI